MRGFQIQEKSIGHNVWVVPESPWWTRHTLHSESVEVLRHSIWEVADRTTLTFARHVRIVTNDGEPVERWVIRPGRARKTWRRY